MRTFRQPLPVEPLKSKGGKPGRQSFSRNRYYYLEKIDYKMGYDETSTRYGEYGSVLSVF